MTDKREFIMQQLNPILEDLVVDTLQEEPQQLITFMIEWLKKNKSKYEKSNAVQQDYDSESDDDDDYIDEKKLVIKKNIQVQRSSISAEVIGKNNADKQFKAPVYPKSEYQVENIRERLNQSFMFNHLELEEQDIIIQAMQGQQYETNETVIQQGCLDADTLFLVESGDLNCYKTINNEDILVKQYSTGDSFGELALLYNVSRQASIITQTQCYLWQLDRETFKNIVRDSAIQKRQEYENFLTNVKILSTLSQFQKNQLTDASKIVRFKKDEQIVKEGDKGDIFYILQKGKACAMKMYNGEQKEVMSYQQGDYFGEIALLREDCTRAASIYAKSDITLFSLDRHSFKRLLGPLEELLKKNLENYKQTF